MQPLQQTSMSKGKRLRLRGESIIMLQGSEEIWLMCLRDWPVLAGTFFRRRSQSYEQWENNGISKKKCPSKLPNNVTGSSIGRLEKEGGSTFFHLSGHFTAGRIGIATTAKASYFKADYIVLRVQNADFTSVPPFSSSTSPTIPASLESKQRTASTR
jgi:hypothetical protein